MLTTDLINKCTEELKRANILNYDGRTTEALQSLLCVRVLIEQNVQATYVVADSKEEYS